MTSPLPWVAAARQVWAETESLTNRTVPSRKAALTPPEWFELAPDDRLILAGAARRSSSRLACSAS